MIRLFIVAILFLSSQVFAQDTHEVTFRVNLDEAFKKGLFNPEKNDTLIVCGNFSEWKGRDYMLSPDNEEYVYTGRFNLKMPEDSVFRYKYVIVKHDGSTCWEYKPEPDHERYARFKRFDQYDSQLDTFRINRYHIGKLGLGEVKFPVKELQEDFAEFREIMETQHGLLYDFTPKAFFDSLFDAQYAKINHPMKPEEFFRVLTPIVYYSGCGHTNVWMPYYFWELGPEQLFPLKIRVLNDECIAVGAYDDKMQIPFGSKISSINGVTFTEILEDMKVNSYADAFNPGYILKHIKHRFPMKYARRYGFPEAYKIEYLPPGSEKIIVKELKSANIEQVRDHIFHRKEKPELFLKLLNDSTAFLRFKSFGYYNEKDFFFKFLDSCFTLIKEKNIQNLILDVRGNSGGDPYCTAKLFAYLEPEPLTYFARESQSYGPLKSKVEREENAFEGKLITLMDESCFSTNAHFCSLLKYHKIGTFVGQPSGGTFTCNGGRDRTAYLKNTHIMVFFTRTRYFTAVEGMDKAKPIMPDYLVTETYDALLEHRDVFLEKAMELIQNKGL